MAVQSDTSRIQYAGNNSTSTSYAVPFYFLENSHLAAVEKNSAGVESAVALTNHVGAGDSNGGTVRTATAVPATSTLTIYRVVPATQTTIYQEGGDFPAASHAKALDKLTMLAQQIDRTAKRSIRVTESEGSRNEFIPAANTMLGLDVNKQPKTMTASDVRTFLSLSDVILSVVSGMKTFADAGERALGVPEFTGQLATQRDTGAVYISTGTAAGNWAIYNGATTFANATERGLSAPQFAGQLGTQRDTGVLYVATGTTAGAWSIITHDFGSATAGTSIAASDEVVIRQGGATKRLTYGNLKGDGRGFRTPTLTSAQRDAVTSPETGLTIFNTDNKRLEAYDGSAWLNSAEPIKWSVWRPRYANDQAAFEAMLDELYDFSGPAFIDLEGNSVTLTGPVYVSSATGLTTYSNYHCIMNGTLVADSAWPAITSAGTKTCTGTANTKTLTMSDTSGLWAGMVMSGSGLSIGTHIVSVDSATQITINTFLTTDISSGSITFFRLQYMLNWLNKSDGTLGFTNCSRLFLRNLQFQCNHVASAILLPQDGIMNHINNCVFLNVLSRCVVDVFGAASGMSFESNEIVPSLKSSTVTISNASPAVVSWVGHGLGNGTVVRFSTTGSLPTGLTAGTNYYIINAANNSFQVSATSGGSAINTSSAGSGTHTARQITNVVIALTISSNDVKIRNNRITTCRHHMILHGGGNLIVGNHWWGGGDRGCYLTGREYKSVITGNYIDNSWIELSDESAAAANVRDAIGDISITGNIFTWQDDWGGSSPQWIRVAPHTANSVKTVTISNASPAVVTCNGHGFVNGQTIRLTTTGSLPTGLTAATDYYVSGATTNTFKLSDKKDGAELNTSSAGSGTHTATPQRYVQDISVTGNTFKRLAAAPSITRIDAVDNSGGLIDEANMSRVYFANNCFEGITQTTEDPATLQKTIASGSPTNSIGFSYNTILPFGGHAMTVISATLRDAKDATPATAYPPFMVYAGHDLATKTNTQMRFSTNYSGTATMTVTTNNVRTSA